MHLKFYPRLLVAALSYTMLVVASVIHAPESNAREIQLIVEPGLSSIVTSLGMHSITLMKRTNSDNLYYKASSGNPKADKLVQEWFRITRIALEASVGENGGTSSYARILLLK
jgi:hypothetical protein